MPGGLELAAAVASICNKMIPGRREAAVKELEALLGLLARALKENEDLLAAQIRKRMKELRARYPEIE